MRILVCIKYVPDAQGERRFSDDFTVDRSAGGILSELDEYPLEEALQIADRVAETEIVALCMGPTAAADAIKKALQIGATRAVHVCDEALAGSDAPATARVIAAAVRRLEAEDAGTVDLVMMGMASTDAGMSVIPSMVSEVLERAALTTVSALTVEEGRIVARRDGDDAVETVEASLPAVVSVTDQINTPRYPSFKGIMAAKKKPVDTWTLADLEIDPQSVGVAAAGTRVLSVTARPPRERGLLVDDDGQGGTVLAHFLAMKNVV